MNSKCAVISFVLILTLSSIVLAGDGQQSANPLSDLLNKIRNFFKSLSAYAPYDYFAYYQVGSRYTSYGLCWYPQTADEWCNDGTTSDSFGDLFSRISPRLDNTIYIKRSLYDNHKSEVDSIMSQHSDWFLLDENKNILIAPPPPPPPTPPPTATPPPTPSCNPGYQYSNGLCYPSVSPPSNPPIFDLINWLKSIWQGVFGVA